MTTRVRRMLAALLAAAPAPLAACAEPPGTAEVATVALAVGGERGPGVAALELGIGSVVLERADGVRATLLAAPRTVELAASGEPARVLAVASVPPGEYAGVTVELLLDGARVHLAGSATPAALADADCAPPPNALPVPIAFAAPVAIGRGATAVLELDLAPWETLVVDRTAGTALLGPAVVARIERGGPRTIAAAGLLRAVDAADGTFRIELDAPPGEPGASVELEIDARTVFEIGGVCSAGDAGLAALADGTPPVRVRVLGELDGIARRLRALAVEAGREADVVEGVIVGRRGGPGADAVLTVRGSARDAAGASHALEAELVVRTTFAGTRVVAGAERLDADALAVGQRVRVSGVLDAAARALDATTATDAVRIEPVRIAGLAHAAPADGALVLDLGEVDGREAAALAWNGDDRASRDPRALVLDVGNLGAGQGIAAGTPVLATGRFLPDGDAGGTDFVATALLNLERAPARLVVRDRPGGLAVATSVSPERVALAFAGTPAIFETATVDRGFAGATDVRSGGLTIVPDHGAGLGLYVIRDRTLGTLELHETFASFAAGLERAFAGSATLVELHAEGEHAPGTSELCARSAAAIVR